MYKFLCLQRYLIMMIVISIGIIVVILVIIGIIALSSRVQQHQYKIWFLSRNREKRPCNQPGTAICKDKDATKCCCKPTTSFRIGSSFPGCNICPGDVFYNIATQSTFIFSGGEWVIVPITNYAEFYALLPPDNQTDLSVITPSLTTTLIPPGGLIEFPQNGSSSSSSLSSPTITRLSNTAFQLAPSSQYNIKATIPTDIDLLASVATYAVGDYTWITSVTGAAAYHMLVNGNFISTITPPSMFTVNDNPPSISDHLWLSNAMETPLVALQIQRLQSAILALAPTSTLIAGSQLHNITLTPGSYITSPATSVTLQSGLVMTFDGDGYYYINVIDGNLTLNGSVNLTNGAKASKIFWVVSDTAFIGMFGGPPTSIVALPQGNIIANTSITIGNGASHIINGGLWSLGTFVVVQPALGGIFPFTVNSSSNTNGYAGSQIILRINGAEQSFTRVGQENPGELSLQTTISTVSSSTPTTIDIAVPIQRSDALQVFRYITGSLAPVTARLTIEQIPL